MSDFDLKYNRVSRAHFSVVNLGDPDDSVEYWRSRSFAERLEYIEHLRRELYGIGVKRRLQRFFEVVEQTQS